MSKKRVVLSTVIPQEGGMVCYKLSKAQALQWLALGEFTNYCAHQTVRAIGIEEAASREVCEGFDEALIVKPRGRLERREYSLEEIEAIGYDIYLVAYFSTFSWGYEAIVPVTEQPFPSQFRGKLNLGGGDDLLNYNLEDHLC